MTSTNSQRSWSWLRASWHSLAIFALVASAVLGAARVVAAGYQRREEQGRSVRRLSRRKRHFRNRKHAFVSRTT